MKKSFLLLITIMCLATVSFSQHHTLRITLDTKQMINTNCSLGADGVGGPSACTKVYAHLGLCTCFLDGSLSRICTDSINNRNYCNSQILPYQSNIWQHVVGNWGDNPQDDGIGQMTNMGNGVYSIEFVVEEYFSNPALVNTEGDTTISVVVSTVWNELNGGDPFTIGMVFRNEDGTLSGRDEMCKDLFIVNLNTNTPQVIQGWDGTSSFPAITILYTPVGLDEINNENLYISTYPNPFSEQTQINYTLTTPTNDLNITVFNALGQEVSKIFKGRQTTGSHSLIWNGTNNNAEILPSGVYYCTMTSDNKMIASQKIVISR